MPKIRLSKAVMLDVLDDSERILRNDVLGKRRWSIDHQIVFRHDDKLYCATYSVGATEMQDEGPWEHDDEVECIEVEAFERTITDYRPVS